MIEDEVVVALTLAMPVEVEDASASDEAALERMPENSEAKDLDT